MKLGRIRNNPRRNWIERYMLRERISVVFVLIFGHQCAFLFHTISPSRTQSHVAENIEKETCLHLHSARKNKITQPAGLKASPWRKTQNVSCVQRSARHAENVVKLHRSPKGDLQAPCTSKKTTAQPTAEVKFEESQCTEKRLHPQACRGAHARRDPARRRPSVGTPRTREGRRSACGRCRTSLQRKMRTLEHLQRHRLIKDRLVQRLVCRKEGLTTTAQTNWRRWFIQRKARERTGTADIIHNKRVPFVAPLLGEGTGKVPEEVARITTLSSR